MYRMALTRYRSATRKQPVPGWGAAPSRPLLSKERGAPGGSAADFQASTPARVEPTEGPVCRPPAQTAPTKIATAVIKLRRGCRGMRLQVSRALQIVRD